jgi:L-aminopeptidase/D-esterase-like protein
LIRNRIIDSCLYLVPGVTVGYSTLISDEIHTGVTAIFPRGRDKAQLPVAAGSFALNGNGEMTGTAWIEECGALTSPIAITNTHAIGVVHRAMIDWVNRNIPQAEWMLRTFKYLVFIHPILNFYNISNLK